jgi:hypothetical protein
MMEIPREVAEELWKDHPNVLTHMKGYTHINCLAGFDEVGKMILTPISLTNYEEGRGCSCGPLAQIRVRLVGSPKPKTEMDDRYDRWMGECLDRAQSILMSRKRGHPLSEMISIAIALFQAKVGQIVTVKRESGVTGESGPTGVQG